MKPILLILILLTFSTKAFALVQIDITQGNIDPLPVALPYFGVVDKKDKRLSKDIVRLIEKNLESSGLFKTVSRRAYIQDIEGSHTIPSFDSWKKINASALLAGNIQPVDDQHFTTEFRLWDVFAMQQLVGKSYDTDIKNWRRISHLIADQIYSRLTGEKGIFDTRIVYVAETGSALKRTKRLAIMDQDGANHRYLTDGSYLVLTPRFSPTNQEIIYLSYQDGMPKVYIRHVDTGDVRLVGNFPGMTFAPRFSADGKDILLSASLDGNSEIYRMSLHSKKRKRLTFNNAIDTSPSFSPDGKRIVFNSDRGGSQQLYVMDRNGKHIKRISFGGKGRYGTPVWSPRGDLIAFTKIYQGRFFIGVMRPDGTGERILTESYMDEGPTWAPNGRVIIFARQHKYLHGKEKEWGIYAIDLTGYNERRVKTPHGASDPAWSPLQ